MAARGVEMKPCDFLEAAPFLVQPRYIPPVKSEFGDTAGFFRLER